MRSRWSGRSEIELPKTGIVYTYTDDVNLLRENINTLSKADILRQAVKMCLEVNAEKTKYMNITRNQK